MGASRRRAACAAAIAALLTVPAGAEAHPGHDHAGVAAHGLLHGDGTQVLSSAARRARRSPTGRDPLAPVDPAGAVAPTMPGTWCGAAGVPTAEVAAHQVSGPHIKVVYAYPSDRVNRFAQYDDVIQRGVRAARDVVDAASGGSRSLRFDLGTACGPAYVDIRVVALPRPASYYLGNDGRPPDTTRFYRVRDDVAQVLGLGGAGGGPVRNVLVYADHLGDQPGFWHWGTALVPADDRADPAVNWASSGGWMAMLWGRGGDDFLGGFEPAGDTSIAHTELLVHEVSHNLGAVQRSAPHSTTASHCTDEADIMCYDDGTGATLTFPCPAQAGPREAYDCGGDDYFNPQPAPGSYLDTHWNLFDSVFLCAPATCGTAAANRPPTAQLTADDLTIAPGGSVTLDARGSSDPDGDALSFDWDLDADGVFSDGHLGPHVTWGPFPQAGSFPATVRVTDARGASATASVTVVVATPQGNRPPVASLTSPDPRVAPGGRVVVDATGSSDPDGDALAYAWDLDDDGTFGDGGFAGASTPLDLPQAPGAYEIHVRVADPAGLTATASLTLVVTQPPDARLTASATSVVARATVRLSAAGSTDPDGSVASYAWDLDGQPGFEVPPAAAAERDVVVPAGARTYAVEVADDDGATATQAVTVTGTVAAVAPNVVPTARLALSRSTVEQAGEVVLDASGSSDPDGQIVRYAFDADGDGAYETAGAGSRLTVRAPAAGRFTLSVQVTDDRGSTAVATAALTVTARGPERTGEPAPALPQLSAGERRTNPAAAVPAPPPAPAAVALGGAAASSAPRVTLAGGGAPIVVRSLARGVPVGAVACPVACSGTADVRAGRRLIATGRFRVAAGGSTVVRPALTRAGRALLARRGRRVRATARIRVAGRPPASRIVILRRG